MLDYLRLAAAASVLGYHYFYSGIVNGKISTLHHLSPVSTVAKYGYLGVELFFLISGFVIMNSARGKSPRQFAVGRAVRLLPAFWVALLITTFATLLFGAASGLSISLWQVLRNVTMTPELLGATPVDGVYWTLQLEVQFYFLVLLLIACRLGSRIPHVMAGWPPVILAVSVVAPRLSDHMWLDPYFALFATGALIADLAHRGPRFTNTVGLAGAVVVAVAFVGIRAARSAEPTGADPVIAMLLVVGFCLLMLTMCHSDVRGRTMPGARWAGGITYPLYLVHAHLGYMALAHLARPGNRGLVYPLVITGVVGLAALVHLLVEKRGAWFWRRLFESVFDLPAWVALRRRRLSAAGTHTTPRASSQSPSCSTAHRRASATVPW